MSRLTNFLCITLLFFCCALMDLSSATRDGPAFSQGTLLKPQHVYEKRFDEAEAAENCERELGKEECLMRRTLTAHLDYIYTQDHKP